MHYGGDYNPEQWPREVWDEDIHRMREAGVTMVSLGIFSWSRIQPDEGVFDFEWLDDIIDRLHAAGVTVDLATATASPPPWMHLKYPEILPVTAEGTTLGPGSRQHYAPSSPVYRRLAAELVTAIAERYAHHPAVVMWHINNEYGCHLVADYSDAAAVAFREWLRARYGSVTALNAAWGTSFWSQMYSDFEQVLPPRAAPYHHNPAHRLDFHRFTSDSMLELYLMEKEIIRAAGALQPITTNFMGQSPTVDYWKWAPHLDVISDDCYPDPNDPESFRTVGGFHRDLMRSFAGGPGWLLMEQASGALNWRPANAPKAPGQMTALSMQAVARGADGVLFFQWRQSRAGTEKFHSAMLPHAGTDTRIWREVVELGKTLAELPVLPETDDTARIGLVFEYENMWALSGTDHPVGIDYMEIVKRWYAAFDAAAIGVDFVHPADDLTRYGLVVAPQLYLLTDAAAENLRDYVAAGGTLVVGAFSDVVDEQDAFLPGGFLTRLGETLGVRLEDFGGLVPVTEQGPGERIVCVVADDGALPPFEGELLAEEIHATSAEAVARFDGGRRDGDPALTVNRVGAGRAFYLATIPTTAATRALAPYFAAQAGVAPLVDELPVGVEVARRGSVLTVINHSTESVRVNVTGEDIRTGERISEALLEPFGWVMLRA